MTIPNLMHAAGSLYGLTVTDLRGPGATRYLTDCRRVVIMAARREGYSLSQVARALRRHHTTILHHERRHAELLSVGDTHEAKIDDLVHQLTGR